MKFMIKTRLKLFKKTQKDIYIIFNLFLDFFNRLLTWRQSNYSHILIIEKLLERRCLKWACIAHLDIWNTSYGQKKGGSLTPN